jgi:POT family proton-dependent oligopeptide transporter
MKEEIKPASVKEKTLFGHPIGLFYLFFAETWERFSYYGMRALLVLYIVDEFFLNLNEAAREEKAFGIYGAYGSLVYATPLIGGIIADRFIGYRKSILLGGILMALGHFAMAIEHPVFFYWALGLLVAGNGFFKPNISALVGTLYQENDPRRDGGFTIFYMGVNLGAFFSPLVCGYLGHTYGWHYGFGAAGVGMLIGLILFVIGSRSGHLGNRGYQPKTAKDIRIGGLLPVDRFIYIVGFLFAPLLSLLIYKNDLKIMGSELMSFILIGVLVIILSVLGYFMFKLSKIERERVIAVVLLTFLIMVFWSFFEQAGSSLTLFAEKNVNLTFLNAAQTQSINPFYIMALAIPFSYMWTLLDKKKLNPPTPVKSAMGLAQLGLGFFIFAYSARYMDASGKVPFIFLALGYLLLTTGELFMSPIGLSKVTELSPAKIVAFMLGVYYLSSSFAHYIAGAIAKLTTKTSSTDGSGIMDKWVHFVTGFKPEEASNAIENVQSLMTYTGVFAQIALVSLGVAVFALLLSPLIKKLMHGIH